MQKNIGNDFSDFSDQQKPTFPTSKNSPPAAKKFLTKQKNRQIC